MLFWLHESRGDVKAAISLTVTSDSSIVIERWALKKEGPSRVPVAHPINRMEIIPRPERPPRIIGCIKIAVRDVFLRNKREGEKLLVFEGQGLEKMANRIWA